MSTTVHTPVRTTTPVRVGQVITALAAAFLLVDAVLHVLNSEAVEEASRELGFDTDLAPLIGLVELVCLAFYLVPRTSVVGAVMLTGYLGGATAVQLRIEAPLFSTMLFPAYIGALVWVGLWLRDERARALVAPRTP